MICRTRPWRLYASATLVVPLIITLVPNLVIELPKAAGSISIAISHILVIPLGIAIASISNRTWCSPIITPPERHWENTALTLAIALSASLTLLAGWAGSGLGPGISLARATLAWTALSLLSHRILGPEKLWVLPIAFFFLAYALDQPQSPGALTWITTNIKTPLPWTTSLVVIALGFLARWATPWRLHALRTTTPPAKP